MINFMKTRRMIWMLLVLILWIFNLLISVGWAASAEDDAVVPAGMAALLVKADEMRLPFREGRVRVELLTMNGDRVTGRSAFEVLQSEGGASRVEMLDARMRGQRALLSDHGLWLYVPSSRRVIRLTPLQRLMGNANYGDIGRMRWSDDYKIVKGWSAVDRPGVWVLRLKAKASTAVYTEVALRLEEETACPLDADFFSASGKLIKSAKYHPPVMLNGRNVIDAITFTGGLSGNTRTRMEMGAFREENLPEYLFTVGGLGK